MISKNRIKLIRSLELKKFRKQEGLFVAEGPKLVGELMQAFPLSYVAATAAWLAQWQHTFPSHTEVDHVNNEELKRASLLQHPQEVIALFEIPQSTCSLTKIAEQELVLALDGVQDPGNLGTIIRLADWFGIGHIFCSSDCTDIFNPKAVQASMGAIARVQVHYIDLEMELSAFQGPIYGTHLDGENLYQQKLSQTGVIIMGNEGKGISAGVSQKVNSRLYIPTYPSSRQAVESLNVAMATAIVCAEFRRRS